MRLGTAIPFAGMVAGMDGAGPGGTAMAEAATGLEQLGYASLWTFDAVGRGFSLPDPLMALTVAAVATNDIELGTGVLQLPIRNVPEVAHRMFTLRLVAGDRLLLGVGPGSTEADFATFGGSYADRFATFDSQWAELKEWLATGTRGDLTLAPWAEVVGQVQLALAGWRGSWVERCAAEGLPWIASAAYADVSTLRDAIARYRSGGGPRAVITNVQIQGDTDQDVDSAIARLVELREIGFDDAVTLDFHPSTERYTRVLAGLTGA